MMFIVVIIVYSLLAIFEFKPLYKKKLWCDFWTNMVLGAFSFTVLLLLSLNVEIPSPAKPIGEWITSIFGK